MEKHKPLVLLLLIIFSILILFYNDYRLKGGNAICNAKNIIMKSVNNKMSKIIQKQTNDPTIELKKKIEKKLGRKLPDDLGTSIKLIERVYKSKIDKLNKDTEAINSQVAFEESKINKLAISGGNYSLCEKDSNEYFNTSNYNKITKYQEKKNLANNKLQGLVDIINIKEKKLKNKTDYLKAQKSKLAKLKAQFSTIAANFKKQFDLLKGNIFSYNMKLINTKRISLKNMLNYLFKDIRIIKGNEYTYIVINNKIELQNSKLNNMFHFKIIDDTDTHAKILSSDVMTYNSSCRNEWTRRSKLESQRNGYYSTCPIFDLLVSNEMYDLTTSQPTKKITKFEEKPIYNRQSHKNFILLGKDNKTYLYIHLGNEIPSSGDRFNGKPGLEVKGKTLQYILMRVVRWYIYITVFLTHLK